MFLLYKGFSLESHHFWNDRLKTQNKITFRVQVHHYQGKKFRLIFWKIFEHYLSYLLTVLWPQKNGRTQQINVRFCIWDFFCFYHITRSWLGSNSLKCFSCKSVFCFFFSFCDSLCEGNNLFPEFVRKAILHSHFPPEICKEFTFFSMMSKVTKYKRVFSFSFVQIEKGI